MFIPKSVTPCTQLTDKQTKLAKKIRSLKMMANDPDYDTMDSGFESLIEDMQEHLIKSIHKTAITPPKPEGERRTKDDEYWRTTVEVKDGDGKTKRKDVRCKTKPGLYTKLYNLYIGPGTLQEIFYSWHKHREEHEGLNYRTIEREQQRWDRFFAPSALAKKRIDEINNFMIEDHIHSLIKKHDLKPKEVDAIKGILRGTFHYALRHKLIPDDPMPLVDINKAGCAASTPRLSKDRVYLSDEVELMKIMIDRELKASPHSTTALAVALLFLLGLRVGELVALRLSDIDWTDGTIHIQRMEQKGKNGIIVVNHTKKKSETGNRILPLGDAGIDIIQRVLAINERYGFQDEDYLFLGEKGERIHIRAIDNRLRKFCLKAGIEPVKSAHDIRRTVATQLYRNTHDIELVRKFLGHSDVQTTWGYIVDVDAEEEDRQRTVEALKGFGLASDRKITPFRKTS